MLSTHLWVNLAQSEAINCSVFSTDASSRNPDGMVRGSPTIQASGKGICPILLSQSIEAQRIFYAYRRVDSLCHSLSFSSTGTRFHPDFTAVFEHVNLLDRGFGWAYRPNCVSYASGAAYTI